MKIAIVNVQNQQNPDVVQVPPGWTFVASGMVINPGAPAVLMTVEIGAVPSRPGEPAFVETVTVKKVCSVSKDAIDLLLHLGCSNEEISHRGLLELVYQVEYGEVAEEAEDE